MGVTCAQLKLLIQVLDKVPCLCLWLASGPKEQQLARPVLASQGRARELLASSKEAGLFTDLQLASLEAGGLCQVRSSLVGPSAGSELPAQEGSLYGGIWRQEWDSLAVPGCLFTAMGSMFGWHGVRSLSLRWGAGFSYNNHSWTI